MKKLDLIQGSEDWLTWRKGIITATDAAVILGKSPYCTPKLLHERKLGLAPEQEVNFGMLNGQAHEPIARQLAIDELIMNFEPCCIQSETHKYLGASLDGISSCERFILEIKSNNKQRHERVRLGKIEEFHLIQMQHCMLCGDGKIEKCYYVSYNSGEIIIVEVDFDKTFLEKYVNEAYEFWENLLFDHKPDLTNRDYLYMKKKSENQAETIEKYLVLDDQIKTLNKIKEEYKNEIITFCDGNSFETDEIKVLKKISQGRIDYESIPELKSINIENYRKPSSESWIISIKK